jgi:hypothetical protein
MQLIIAAKILLPITCAMLKVMKSKRKDFLYTRAVLRRRGRRRREKKGGKRGRLEKKEEGEECQYYIKSQEGKG